MKNRLVVFIILLGAAILYEPVVEACGSKFLVGSRAARYQRMRRAVNPSTILIYTRQDVNAPEEERLGPKFKAATLRDSGAARTSIMW